MHQLNYQFKILLRNKSMLFWITLFPLILATFFHLAFSQLYTNFEPVQLAVVEKKDNQVLKELLNELSIEDQNQLLDVSYVTLETAQNLLKNEDVSAYLIIDDELQLLVNEQGISESIVQSVIDTYQQTVHSFETIADIHPQALAELVHSNNNINYLKSQNISSLDVTVIYFYTLIGMACMNGSSWGLKVSTNVEANLSRQGTRIQIAPISKMKMICIGNFVAFCTQYFSMMVLLLYLTSVLGVAFGNQLGYICLLIAAGSYVGITMGNLIGQIFRCSENTKSTILTTVTMLCSFLAGMMIIDIKYLIQDYAPLLAYINPVSVITDALYALYYYPTYERFVFNVVILVCMGILLTMMTIGLSRRKQYDYI